MDFRHMLASAFARRIAYLVVAALIAFGTSWFNTASAQTNTGPDNTPLLSGSSEAFTKCKASMDKHRQSADYIQGGGRPAADACSAIKTWGSQGIKYYECNVTASGGYACSDIGRYFPWDDSSGDQCPGSAPDPLNPGQCLTEQKCLARNAELGNFTGTRAFDSNTNTTSCVAGCMMDFSAGQNLPVRKGVLYLANGLQSSKFFMTGEYKYTGGFCGAAYRSGNLEQKSTKVETKESAKPKAEECQPIGGGQTACRKDDGRLCATARTGREICWSPHELGSKADGDIVQNKKAGSTAGAASVALTNGDSANKKTEFKVVETTTSASGDTRTSTSMVSTYQTVSGASASPKYEGSPTTVGGTGADGAAPEEGDDGDGDSAGGGATCAAAPSCSGDAINCAVLDQAWRIRCANDSNDNGMDDWLEPKEGDGALPDDGQDGEPGTGEKEISASLIEMGGFGGSRSCPALGSINIPPFGSFSFDDKPWLCDMVNLIRALMYLLAAFVSIRILME